MANENISFIVPVLNGEKYIRHCLEHVIAEMEPEDELIVVDNGSIDSSVKIASGFPEAKIEIKSEMTIAGLRNMGAARTTGAVLAFIDSDCILQEGWRDGVNSVLIDQSISVTGSTTNMGDDATWVEKSWWSTKHKEPQEVHYLPSANFVIRRDAFESVGGFNEYLETDEDSDICARLVTAGKRIFDSPAIAFIHLGNAKTVGSFLSKEYWHATSILATMQIHGVDKPMIMTFAFIAALISFLWLIWLSLAGVVPPWMLPIPLLIVPVVTVAYRVIQYGNARWAPHLLLLYFLYYSVRSLVIIRSLFRKNNRLTCGMNKGVNNS